MNFIVCWISANFLRTKRVSSLFILRFHIDLVGSFFWWVIIFISWWRISQRYFKYLLARSGFLITHSNSFGQVILIILKEIVHGYPHFLIICCLPFLNLSTLFRPVHIVPTRITRVCGRLGPLKFWFVLSTRITPFAIGRMWILKFSAVKSFLLSFLIFNFWRFLIG